MHERREFSKILVAQGTSVLGSQFALIATPLATYELTHSASAAGIVGVSNGLARTAAGLISGPIADRLNPVRVMISCDLGRLAATLLLSWIILTRATDNIAVLSGLVLIEGALSTMFYPCEAVVIVRIVAKERLPIRLARSESLTWGAALVGPPIGGLLFSVDSALPFLGNAASYLISAICIYALEMRRSEVLARVDTAESGIPGFAEMLAGLRIILRDRFLRPVILQVTLHNVALGALAIIVVVGAQQRGVSGTAIGVLVAAQAAGAILGSFGTMFVLGRVGGGKVILVTGWTWVALIPLIISVTNLIALSILLALLWILAPIQRTVLGTYRGQRVPPSLLGRVTSASALITGSLAALGPGLGGELLSGDNLGVSIVCLIIITVAPMIVSTFISPVGHVTISTNREQASR
ncbi:MAG: MFS transporter [Candidatus Dormibacteria bacterium]